MEKGAKKNLVRDAMYIKQVVTEGFRCYKDRVEADPFSPRHNVIGAPAVMP